MPRRRLAVALLLPGPLDVEVDALRLACGDPTLGRVRPHVTLVPPVNVREDGVADALTVLRRVAAVTRPFTVALGPPSTFLPVNPVLYLTVEDAGGSLRALRDAVFTPPLARPLTWPFVPHVTLADGGDPARLTGAVTTLAGYRRPARFERLHLLEERRREGDAARIWVPVADVAFRGPAVVGRGGLELELSVTDRLAPDVLAWRAAASGPDDLEHVPGSVADRPLAVTARREGEVVGVVDGLLSGQEARLRCLLVDRDARRQGVGSHLLAAFTGEAAGAGSTHVTVEVAAGSPAETLFTRRGFVAVGSLPAWWRGREVVALRRDL